jgi:hypothetical protein
MNEIKILVEFQGIGIIRCILSDNVNPRTYHAFVSKIPFEAKVSTWGKEVYFETPVSASVENGRQDVEVGDIGFWPPGKAMCLFFGPTPLSRGNKPRAASPVNIIGMITENIELLSKVIDGTTIKVRLVK